MTDNEIKKGLELTIELILNDKISQLNDEQKHHICFILASALDAIDVKNEAMQATINGQETLQEYIAKQDKEIERLSKGLPMSASYLFKKAELDELITRAVEVDSKYAEKIKAEAYKEFAELLCEIWQRYEDENISGIYVPKWVMRVYEEMVGEGK